MRVGTMSLICVTRAKPDMPFTCPFPDHHLDALTVRVEVPKLLIAVAVAVYHFLA